MLIFYFCKCYCIAHTLACYDNSTLPCTKPGTLSNRIKAVAFYTDETTSTCEKIEKLCRSLRHQQANKQREKRAKYNRHIANET